MKNRFKRHQNRRHIKDEVADEELLRFRNVERSTQECLEKIGITTQVQLQSAVDKFGVDGLIAQMDNAGYTPPKHDKWRILGAVRGKDWKEMLKEMRGVKNK